MAKRKYSKSSSFALPSAFKAPSLGSFSSLPGLSGLTSPSSAGGSLDLSDPDVLAQLLEASGQKPEKPKANILERILGVLGILETGPGAYALASGKGLGGALSAQLKSMGNKLVGAITGDKEKLQEASKGYQDVLKKLGMEKGFGRTALGILGDVFLDPSTYLSLGSVGGGKVLAEEGGELAVKTLGKKGSEVFAKELGEGVAKGLTREAAEEAATKTLQKLAEEGAEDIFVKGAAKTVKFGLPGLTLFEKEIKTPKFLQAIGEKVGATKAGTAFTGVKNALGGLFGGRFGGATGSQKELLDMLGNRFFAAAKAGDTKALELWGKRLVDLQKTAPELEKYIYPLLEKTMTPEGLKAGKKLLGGTLSEISPYLDQVLKGLNANENALKVASESGLKITKENLPELFSKSTVFRGVLSDEAGRVVGATADDAAKQALVDLGLLKQTFDSAGGAPLPEMLGAVKEGSEKIMTSEEIAKLTAAGTDKQKQAAVLGEILGTAKETQLPKPSFFDADEWKALTGEARKLAEFRQLPGMDQMISDWADYAKKTKDVYDYFGLKTIDKNYAPRKVMQDISEGKIPGVLGKKSQLSAISTMGGAAKHRVFDTWAEGVNAGYKYVKPDAAITEYVAKAERLTALKEYFDQLTRAVDASGNKILTKAGDQVFEQFGKVSDLGLKEIKGISGLKGYSADPEVVGALETIAKQFTGDEATNQFLRFYDKINGIWKASVTGLSVPGTKIPVFPAYHVRNAVGNVYNAWLVGLNNPVWYARATEVERYAQALNKGDAKLIEQLGAKNIPGVGKVSNVYDMARKYGVYSGGELGDVEEALKQIGLGKSRAFGATEIGSMVENNGRLALFMDQLSKGKSLDDATMAVKKALFDYSDLSAFEKNVMKRIIPFYTWTKNNIRFQFEMMLKAPGKQGAVLKTMRNLKDAMMEDIGATEDILPAWMQAKLGFPIKGGKAFLTGFGLPIESLSDTVGLRQVLNMLSPAIKTPIELGTGYSFFKGGPISEDVSGYQYRNMPQFLKDFLRFTETPRTDKAGVPYTSYRVDPMRKYALNAIFGRLMSSAGKYANIGEEGATSVLPLLTGVKAYDINRQQLEEKKRLEEAKLMQQLLYRLGIGGYYTNYYIPKAQQQPFALPTY